MGGLRMVACLEKLQIEANRLAEEIEEMSDESEEHGPDCECGQCTGEDRALEAMEKGICECERMFEQDHDYEGGL